MTTTSRQHIWSALGSAMLLSACGGSGNGGDVIVVFPGDGLPLETFEGMDVADIDGDGLPDFVAASAYDEDTADRDDEPEQRLNVFIQDPAAPGTFAPPLVIVDSLGRTSTWAIIADDVTMNGGIDVVAQDLQQWGFRIFPNDSTAPLQWLPPIEYNAPGTPGAELDQSVAVGDIDGDLFPDVVITAGGSLVAFLQDSANPGTFTAGRVIGAGTRFVAINDVDGDGLNDLLTFREVSDAEDNALYYRQNPVVAGSFLTPLEFQFNLTGESIVVADVDGDGLRDVTVFGADFNGDEFEIHFAAFLQVTPIIFSRLPGVRARQNSLLSQYAGHDLDGDGHAEMVIGHNSNPDYVEILSLDASGHFASTQLLPVPVGDTPFQPRLRALAIDDLNDDQRPDIAVTAGGLFVFFQSASQSGVFRDATSIAAQR